MLQQLIVGMVVIAAAAWVVWSMVLPQSLKARLRPGRAGGLPRPVPRRRR